MSSGGIVAVTGFGALFSVAAVWVVTNPDKAATAVGKLMRSLHWAGRTVRRKSIGLMTQGRANSLLDAHIFAKLDRFDGLVPARLRVHLVQDTEDIPRRISDGQIIVRVRDEGDETRNVLRVIRVAAPAIFGPAVRPFLEEDVREAIDLQLLRRIARSIGPQAEMIFATDFLGPAEIASRPTLATVLRKLQKVDEAGLFVTILLQELDYLGMRAMAESPDIQKLREEMAEFIERLTSLATRQPGEETTDLCFLGDCFRVGFTLLAKSAVAEMGPPPYLRRIQLNLASGCESVYLWALTDGQRGLFHEILEAIKGIGNVETRQWTLIDNQITQTKQSLALLRSTDFSVRRADYTEGLRSQGISEGARLPATITSVGESTAIVSIGGIPASLVWDEVDWGFRGDVRILLNPGETCDVLVTAIDPRTHEIHVSLKQCLPSPWDDLTRTPQKGQRYRVQVAGVDAPRERLTVFLPEQSVWGVIRLDDWLFPSEYEGVGNWLQLVGQESEAEVVFVARDRDLVRLSRRAAAPVDWEEIRRRYPSGTRVMSRVVAVQNDGLLVEIEPGVLGWMDRHDVIPAGYEFKDFANNVVVGQRLELVVRLFQSSRRRFTVEFDRSRWSK
jgi:hypothetical protein